MQRLTTLLLLAGITFTAQAQTNCGLLHDSNSNGFVDIEDFLSILGLFGDQDSDGDGLYDSQDNCIDLTACNFMDVNAEFCSYPDAIGDCNGNCPLDEDGDGVCDLFSCGTSINYQGYDYATVFIGGQCWFAENLRSEFYLNGDSIPSNLTAEDWMSTAGGAVSVYGEGASDCHSYSPADQACDETWSLSEYGRLYNLPAVLDARGLCPSGWHVPTDGEWWDIVNFLGGPDFAGEHMKATYGWSLEGNGSNGTDLSGFTALPAGSRNVVYGSFGGAGKNTVWWSSTPYSYGAWVRYLIWDDMKVGRSYDSSGGGKSVRCIQDAE